MKKNLKYWFVGMLVLLMNTLVWPGLALPGKQPAPLNHHGAKKWRIGYCESDPFVNYASTLYGLVQGLHELGWLDSVDGIGYQPGQTDTTGMWRWLAASGRSSRLEFVGDAYFSLETLDETAQQKINTQLQQKQLDLMLVMGTQAGKLLAGNRLRRQTPVMVFSASNPVQSGISKTVTNSGRDNVWAQMDPQRFRRQIEVFYNTFKFRKLGIVYENSATAYDYSAIAQIEAMAKQKGFSISRIYVAEPHNPQDRERYYADLAQAYQQLAGRVDAMYLTVAAIDRRWLPQLLAPFYARKIPVFSQLGADEVKYGALMSVSSVDFKNLGRFGAQNMTRFFNGAALRALPQVFESTPTLIVNLKVAQQIGYRFPFETLLSADQVFTKVGAQ